MADSRRPPVEARTDESITAIYSPAGGHLAPDGGHFACGLRRLAGSLPVSALPEVDYPTIQVQTFYPGASPDVMASVRHRSA